MHLLLATALLQFLARNWAIVAMASTVTTLLVLPALIVLKYVRISLNIMRNTKPPLSRNPLDFERVSGELVSFPAFDGLPLNGMMLRADPDTPRRGIVIFAHEYCADMHSCARYCRPLLNVGYDVFTFDFRGHGQSDCEPEYTPRQWVSDRDLHDMRGAVAFVQAYLEEQRLPAELGLFGISRGACAAILVAAEAPSVKAIVSDGAFSTDTTIEYFMKRWAYIFARVRVVYENHPPAFWRFLRWAMMLFARREFRCSFPSVRRTIARMRPCPILFIHGDKDSYLPVEQSRRLYALAAQPKYLWVVPGAKHNQAAVLHPEKYSQLTIGFFDRYLAGDTPPVAAAGAALSRQHEAQPTEPVASATSN